MREYKVVYIRIDGSSYSINFTFKGTRYEIYKHAESLKHEVTDALVYLRTKGGENV